MTSFQDSAVMLKKETTYKTGVTVDRSFEFVEESFGWDKNVKQGQGLRAGSRVARSARRAVPTASGGGDVGIECISKGMGYVWEQAMGSGTSTLVSGTTYQQVFTLSDTPPSATVQKQIPRVDGTLDAYTFLGGMVTGFEVNCPNADIATLKTSWDFGDLTTATAAAANAYPVSTANLFHFANLGFASGTLTSPTATALASGTTTLSGIRACNVSLNHNLTLDRYNGGGVGRKDKPTPGLREITCQITQEYINATFRDAILNETPMAFILTLTAGALSTGTETLQVVLPEMKCDNPLVVANGTDLITTPLQFSVLDNLTAAQPIWVVTRTSDSAL